MGPWRKVLPSIDKRKKASFSRFRERTNLWKMVYHTNQEKIIWCAPRLQKDMPLWNGNKKLERECSWHEKTLALNEKKYMKGEKRTNRESKNSIVIICYLLRKHLLFTYVPSTKIEAGWSRVNMVKVESETWKTNLRFLKMQGGQRDENEREDDWQDRSRDLFLQ